MDEDDTSPPEAAIVGKDTYLRQKLYGKQFMNILEKRENVRNVYHYSVSKLCHRCGYGPLAFRLS